jgi:hypothetical protein
MCLFLMIAMISCRKDKAVERGTPIVYIPHGDHPEIAYMMLYHSVTTLQRGPSIYNAWGAFIADKLSGTFVDTSGNSFNIDLSWEEANFARYQSFYHTVGSVTVNNTPLYDYWFVPFVLADSTAVWNENANNTWQVLDSNQATIMSASATGPFPSFNGILPDSISRQSNFTFTFDASNCAHADSAYVVIISDDWKSQGTVVGANGGTSIIAAQHLQNIPNLYFGLRPNSTLWGGIMKVVLFNHSFQTINGKRYVFVNEREILGKVVFY